MMQKRRPEQADQRKMMDQVELASHPSIHLADHLLEYPRGTGTLKLVEDMQGCMRAWADGKKFLATGRRPAGRQSIDRTALSDSPSGDDSQFPTSPATPWPGKFLGDTHTHTEATEDIPVAAIAIQLSVYRTRRLQTSACTPSS